jgi:hypothetical protein
MPDSEKPGRADAVFAELGKRMNSREVALFNQFWTTTGKSARRRNRATMWS